MKKAMCAGSKQCMTARYRTNAIMASKDTDYIPNQSYVSNRRLLLFSGIWPYQEPSKRVLRTRIVTLLLVLGIIVQTRVFMTSDFKLESIIEIMETLLPSLSFTCCYYNLCNNYVTVKILFDRIRDKWNETINKDELKCMQKSCEESKFYLFILSCIIFIYIIILIFPSVVHVFLYTAGVINESQLILPIQSKHSLTNRIYFFFILSAQYLLIITTCAIGIVYGTIHLTFVQHACTLFDVAMIKIDEPFKRNPDNFCWICSDNKYGEEYDWIVTVVKYYNEAINYVKLIKFVCEKSLPIEVCLALLFIIVDILYLLQLNNVMENLKEAAQNCTYIGGTLIITYAYCYLGQKVIDHNNNLFIKCCQVPIYTLSIKTQKILLLLITRNMRPCNFSIMGMFVISNEAFLNIVRASYTFAMVFHNMQ